MLEILRPFYPIFFASLKRNPEGAHNSVIKILEGIWKQRHKYWAKWLIKELERNFCGDYPLLRQRLWGLDFPNPLGLAPGFDKNAQAAGIWKSFGFGFAELGAVTFHSQPGNPPPRMFRLPKDKALLNRMGANNDGAAAIASRLQETWEKTETRIPIGINLCKSKITPNREAKGDYLASFRLLKGWADYFVVNVSSPNTPGLRELQGGEELESILGALQEENKGEKPILLKIAPDLDKQAIGEIVKVARKYQLAGIVATNTTTSREGLKTRILDATGKPITEEAGGISGLPLQKRSTEIIAYIYHQTGGEMPIVGVGGIFDAESAWEKITAGATLLQFYTGWIYQGPWVVPTILRGLSQKVQENGFKHLSEAVGCRSAAFLAQQ
ncbi:MAG: quinone-dependent dihydroorotate dehydrogenase [Geminocystis sp.]|nr:quinone-dependent dihydroorotate dehydrogenase [Geminocystis sp.]HIK36787.1 quinone-dependent dihydroorotate dehydrogenase [Geminocystis sp. M7585_C2015_104]